LEHRIRIGDPLLAIHPLPALIYRICERAIARHIDDRLVNANTAVLVRLRYAPLLQRQMQWRRVVKVLLLTLTRVWC
jgi:hypothetical protein